MNLVPHAIFLAIAAGLAGCDTFNAERHDEAQAEVFGASVQNMVRSQIANPQAPGTTPAPGAIDGDKAVEAVKTYRSDKARIDDARTPPTLLMPTHILER